MGFWSIFLDSLVLLKKQHKLFLPKMAIAFLYGFLMVLVINLLLLVLSLQPSIEAGIAIDPYMLCVILTGCLVVLILLAIVPLLDVLTNAMYPTLVKEFWEKKKILFMDAIKPIKGKLLRLFFSVLFIETILAIPFSLLCFLVALIQTYHMVLNPSIFLKYKEF